MKRYLTPAMYEVHWKSPRKGIDYLLGSSTNIAGANSIAKRQAKRLVDTPWEPAEDKVTCLKSMYVLNIESGDRDCMDLSTEEYVDNLISQLEAEIANK